MQSNPLPAEKSCAPTPPPAVETDNELAPEPPPTLTEDGRLAADPVEIASLTGDNGGGTSGNHGNGTAG